MTDEEHAEMRREQAESYIGKVWTFRYDGETRKGTCTAAKYVGRDADKGIPDFAMTIRSLIDGTRTCRINLVEHQAYCEELKP